MKDKRGRESSLNNFLVGNCRGTTLLLENIIFIILNIVFIIILILFLYSKMGGAAVLEEKYAKEIALILDASKPGMTITLNMADAIQAAKSNLGENSISNIVNIQENIVTVKLQNGQGYSYSFFNNVTVVNYYLNKADNNYIFLIGGYNGKA